MPDVYSLGPSVVYTDERGFTVPISSAQRIIDEDGASVRDLEDWGEVKVSCALGLTALAAPSDEDGTGPEGVIIENIGGLDGHCVAAWDVRCASVVGEMSPGDTCLHGTHLDASKRARVFCKENLLALLVGDDLAFVLDNGDESVDPPREKQVSLMAFGHGFQITEDGIKFAGKDGVTWWELFDGAHAIVGPVALGGATGAGALVLAGALATAFTTVASMCGADVGAAAAFTALAEALATYSTKQTTAV